MSERAIWQAVLAAGSVAELARRLGLKPPSVFRWIREDKVPAERVLQVESATGVPRHELRPDLYPIEPAEPA